MQVRCFVFLLRPEHLLIFPAERSTASRQCGTAPCTTPSCSTESLPMGRKSTWPSLHIWRSVTAPAELYLFFLLNSIFYLSAGQNILTVCPFPSLTIASSLLLLPKTSAWSSTPETQRSPLHVPSGTSLGADTPKLLTGETDIQSFL